MREALEELTRGPENFLIRAKGRDRDEEALVWVADGRYRGYGFVPKSQQVGSLRDLEPFLSPQRAYPETDQILQAYLLKQTRNGDTGKIIKVAESGGYGGLW